MRGGDSPPLIAGPPVRLLTPTDEVHAGECFPRPPLVEGSNPSSSATECGVEIRNGLNSVVELEGFEPSTSTLPR
jgi:hypothetical protein